MGKEDLYRPGLEGIPACRSKIGFVDGANGILKYRGISIEELAEKSTFEEVSFLLLHGNLPKENELKMFNTILWGHRRLKLRVVDIIRDFPPNGHPMDALLSTMTATGMFHGAHSIKDRDDVYGAAYRIISKLPTILAMFHRVRTNAEPIMPRDDLPHAANLYFMLTGKEPTAREAKMFDVALILHAEHGLNASTFSTRVTGSAMANPYAAVSAAIATLSGPLHGGANERVLAMLKSIGSKDNVRSWVEDKIAKKEKIMGLGHRVYKTNDPRATILKSFAKELMEDNDPEGLYAIATDLETIAQEKLGTKGIYANVDFWSGLVYQSLGIDIDLFTPVFAVARSAGWMAHYLEQMEGNRIFRPTQLYEGGMDDRYVPMSER